VFGFLFRCLVASLSFALHLFLYLLVCFFVGVSASSLFASMRWPHFVPVGMVILPSCVYFRRQITFWLSSIRQQGHVV